ncbi:MAG: hypothetical protein H0T60_02570 [Acidobacteria bacterium]|nr:hypothetical protein [Acidobacteriota bacterium]
MAAKQASKGVAATPAVDTTYKNPFSGGNIAPTRETDNLEETDSNRDQGVAYVSTSGVEGSPEFYARDSSIAAWLFWTLGATAPTGTTPNFTHTITPANSLPYVTLWRNISDTLFEEFKDCQVSELTVSADAGAPLMVEASVVGRQATRLTADPSITPAIALQSSQVYNFNNAAVTLGGGATSLVGSFELSVENNVEPQQTDDVVPYDVVAGTREVSLGFDLIFESLDEYNKFHYGGAAGTTISPNIFTTSATFTFTLGTNNEISFSLPSIAYEEFDVEPDAGGDPITVSARAVAQRSGSPVVTATVKNQIATY